MEVKNMTSKKTGREVPNQFVVTTDAGQYFQSYDSIIVFVPFYVPDECEVTDDGKIQLDEKYWNYSTTTSRYRNQFLDETTKETQAKINSGEYVLTNLN